MKNLTAKLSKDANPAQPLTQVLKENELAKDLVKESADELASVNVTLNEELANRNPLPEVGVALEKSQAIEIKVQHASEKLSSVNQALEHEVKERHILEQALTTVMDQHEEALQVALHDALTGLPNRVLFRDRLEHGIALAKRHGWSLAVMFMDLDGFKAINDTYGHDAGDAVLRMVAQRLKENTRSDDTVSRHGGDEFLYLFMEMTDDQDAALVAEKIIEAVQMPCDIGTGELSVNTSLGISIFPKNGTTVDELIKSADAAMYQAKRLKSGYSFASDDTPGDDGSAAPV